jgi:hypothetical protein
MTMKTSITSQKRMTDGQVAKVKELVGAALRKSELDKQGVQRVIEQGDELQNRLIPIFKNLGELPYADEEVESNDGYPKEWSFKSVLEQVKVLQSFEEFKNLDATHVIKIAEKYELPEVPEEADGLVVIPKLSKVASSYNEATELMTDLMAKHRKDWYNYRKGYLGPEYLRLTEKTQQALTKLERETPGDYLVIPVQTGLRHRGRSVRRARVMFGESEFGLGPYEVGIILLVHPERLQQYEHLSVDCAGCEYSPDAGGEFSHYLYFFWSGGELKFDDDRVDIAHRHYGSASGFFG